VKNILVAIDDIQTTTIASPIIARTIELASAFSSKVWILHIVPQTRESVSFNVDDAALRHAGAAELSDEHESLHALARCLRDRGVDAGALLIEGATVRTLLRESDRLAIDLIVMGCHRHGVPYGVLLEFTEEGVLGKCSHPIMYVPME